MSTSSFSDTSNKQNSCKCHLELTRVHDSGKNEDDGEEDDGPDFGAHMRRPLSVFRVGVSSGSPPFPVFFHQSFRSPQSRTVLFKNIKKPLCFHLDFPPFISAMGRNHTGSRQIIILGVDSVAFRKGGRIDIFR